MLIEKVTNEMLAVKNINITKTFGSDAHEFIYNFIRTSKKSCTNDIYKRKLATIRRFATLLGVPVSFIVGILKYERIDEIETITNN